MHLCAYVYMIIYIYIDLCVCSLSWPQQKHQYILIPKKMTPDTDEHFPRRVKFDSHHIVVDQSGFLGQVGRHWQRTAWTDRCDANDL